MKEKERRRAFSTHSTHRCAKLKWTTTEQRSTKLEKSLEVDTTLGGYSLLYPEKKGTIYLLLQNDE